MGVNDRIYIWNVKISSYDMHADGMHVLVAVGAGKSGMMPRIQLWAKLGILSLDTAQRNWCCDY